MIEELKVIIEMIAGLPHFALWVIAAFWAYKVIVIGSIYGVIRLAITKFHDFLVKPKDVDLDHMCASMNIKKSLILQLSRIPCQFTQLDPMAVNWLKEAIDEKLQKSKPHV